MSFMPTRLTADQSRELCACVGPCSGYNTCSNCPPLIVLAVLSCSQAASPAITSAKEVLQ
ncbi:hypothetical protein [Tunturiibacter gelidiferens]|uniref:hypothetical protein n=1 Tax=Tunturiibacter gelidiferens TaxID=3069689 RepID=UPI003D9BDBBD